MVFNVLRHALVSVSLIALGIFGLAAMSIALEDTWTKGADMPNTGFLHRICAVKTKLANTWGQMKSVE